MFNKFKIIPIVQAKDEIELTQKMDSLNKANLCIAEIVFRNDYAKEALAVAIKNYPHFLTGAGTIINEEQAKQAIKLGAQFIVSPGFSAKVAITCQLANVIYLPGCLTPTEIMMALEHGINVVKFFPANILGGISAIKALSSAFPTVRFVPTGGVDLSNIDQYLGCDKVIAVGGSFMMKEDSDKVLNLLKKYID